MPRHGFFGAALPMNDGTAREAIVTPPVPNEPFSLRRLQRVELAMLKEVVRICEKYSLRHFLIGGSALGAIRHAGFIPWDEDEDVRLYKIDYFVMGDDWKGKFDFLMPHCEVAYLPQTPEISTIKIKWDLK